MAFNYVTSSLNHLSITECVSGMYIFQNYTQLVCSLICLLFLFFSLLLVHEAIKFDYRSK